jgi:hypothetical protein
MTEVTKQCGSAMKSIRVSVNQLRDFRKGGSRVGGPFSHDPRAGSGAASYARGCSENTGRVESGAGV